MDYGLWFTIIQIQINLLDYANFLNLKLILIWIPF